MTHSIRTRQRHLTAISAFFLLALLLVAACSDDDPVTPEPTPLPEVSGTLGASGGTLKSSDGTMELSVPAGALAADTDISIKEVEDTALPTVGAGMQVLRAFNMTPAGLPFAIPATLTLDLDLPVPSKTRVRRVAIPVAVVSDDVLDIPQGRTLQEGLNLTIDQNKTPATGVVTLRGLSTEGAVGVPVGKGGDAFLASLATYNDWNEAPREGESFENRVGLETSAGLSLRASVQFKATDLLNLSTSLSDGDPLPLQTEGGTTNGGYRRDYSIGYLPATTGSAQLTMGMTYELDHDYAEIFGTDFEAPVIKGYTWVDHYLENIGLTVEPVGSGSDFLGVGLYGGEAAGEGIYRIRNLMGFKYNDTVLTSGGNGTRIRSLSQANPLATISNHFETPGQLAYGAFLGRDGSSNTVTAGLTYFQYGVQGILLSPWDDSINDFGWSQGALIGHNVTDGQPFGGNPSSGGVVFSDFTAGNVRLFQWDAVNSGFNAAGTISSFPGATGSPVTAAVWPEAGALVITDGFPGGIYFHDRADYFAAATFVGAAGDSPRRLRVAGNLGVISNYGADNLSVLGWDGSASVNLIGTVPVGDGPVGIDLMPLDGGNLAVASTGFNDNTFTVTILSPSGATLSNVTTNLPAGAEGPGHVAWLGDPNNLLMITNNTTGNIAVVESGLQ